MTTPVLELTEVSQADTPAADDLNDSFWALDVVVQLSVRDKDLVEPPAGATQGDRYIVPALGATGDWVGHGRHVAYLTPQGWQFRAPREGWVAYVQDEALNYRFLGTEWVEDAGGGAGAGSLQPGATWVRGNGAIATPVNDVAVFIPSDQTVVGVSVLTAGGSGSCVVDIRRTPIGTYPPGPGDSICGSAKPTIISGLTYRDTTLSGWSVSIQASDCLVFSLESASAFTAIFIKLELEPA